MACIALALGITDNARGNPEGLISYGRGTPAVSLSRTSLAFGSQSVNTTSTAQTVTLSNTGNATLSISVITVTGANRTNFAEGNTCGRSVAAGASCTIRVTFKPSASGSFKASVSIMDNARVSLQTVSLSGTGTLTASMPTAPEDGLSPTTLAFGSQLLGTPSTAQTATLSNSGNATMNISSLVLTGTNASDFAQTNTCGSSVAAGNSCTISVTFTPTASGTRTASVSITDNASGSPQSVSLTGTGNNPAPTLASLSPASAVAGAGSQTLTLTGTNFLAGSTVTYNGVGHTATFVSATQLTISLSATDQATAGSYAVVVTNPAPGGGTSSALSFAVNNPAPTLTSLSPASALAGAGLQTLTLTGTSFVAGSTVTYNGVGHTTTFVSSTQLTISLSATDQATTGSYAVVVTNPAPGGGTSSALNFAVNNPAPTLTSLSPASAVAGAGSQTLTLTGTNFLASSTVTNNGVGHTATLVSSTQLTISLSATDQATAGSYAVVVTNPAPGGGTSGALNFAVNNPAPTLASLSPASAVAGAGSQTLTLTGTNLLASSTVIYNGVGHTATFVSSTQLTISLSATDQATGGNYAVVVTNPAPGGGTSSALNFAVNNPAPTLTSLSPASAVAGAGSQTLTLTGTNFVASSTVTYNGVGHAATLVSATQLTISLSATDQATAGSYAVVVTNPAPGGGASSALSFAVNNPAPRLTSLSPASAVAGAGSQTLTLTGANFVASSTVTYNGVGHAATFVSSTQLTISLSATDQATAGSYAVVVTNPAPGGGTSSALTFAVNNPAPTLTSLSPASAVVGAGSQTLTLTGTNFLASSTVTYNGVGHTATLVSSTQLTISLSATDQATAGSYAVVVTNPAPGGGTSSALSFAVNNPAPTLTSLSPASAVAGAGSQTLTLTGTNFLSSSTVTYNGVVHTATFASSTQLTISLSGTDQATAGSYAVVVTNPAPGGGTSSALNFTVGGPIVSLSPTSLAFGNQSADMTSAAQTVTLSNTGNAALSITSLGFTGTNASDFDESNTCGSSLAAGANCTIAVMFTPSIVGTEAASLSIADSASGNPQTVSLSGAGTHDVILTWTASTTPGVVGYNVYRGTTSGGPYPTELNSSPINGTTYCDSSVQAGQTYYYVVTAVASNDVTQSADSNQASAAVP
jgi:formiminotetrahydrofolate cyclodeaminase